VQNGTPTPDAANTVFGMATVSDSTGTFLFAQVDVGSAGSFAAGLVGFKIASDGSATQIINPAAVPNDSVTLGTFGFAAVPDPSGTPGLFDVFFPVTPNSTPPHGEIECCTVDTTKSPAVVTYQTPLVFTNGVDLQTTQGPLAATTVGSNSVLVVAAEDATTPNKPALFGFKVGTSASLTPPATNGESAFMNFDPACIALSNAAGGTLAVGAVGAGLASGTNNMAAFTVKSDGEVALLNDVNVDAGTTVQTVAIMTAANGIFALAGVIDSSNDVWPFPLSASSGLGAAGTPVTTASDSAANFGVAASLIVQPLPLANTQFLIETDNDILSGPARPNMNSFTLTVSSTGALSITATPQTAQAGLTPEQLAVTP
jgi:hypothetical protein